MERPYLSIGEVLALLKSEFPEITISKIRFLEKGGLVNPERTPSGYRKFYEADIERLRQVLRLQKEQFLPLRVIREVLDTSPDEAEPEEVLTSPTSAPARPAGGVVLASVASVGTSAAAVVRVSPAEEAATAAPGPRAAEAARPLASVPPPLAEQTSEPPPRAGTWAAPRGPEPATRMGGGEAVGPRPVRPPAPLDPPALVEPPARAERNEARGSGGAPGRVNGSSFGSLRADAGMTLTAEELCAAVGMEAAELDELRHFGLIKARVFGGTEYFGEDELTVATLAARLARHGVQARHLRMYLTAAEREASFVAQLVLPYLKQRNPDARRKATETAEEVTRLGQSLRATLLRMCLEAELTF